jgi:hypothetical protein
LPKSKKEESVLFCKNLKEQKPKKPFNHVNSLQSPKLIDSLDLTSKNIELSFKPILFVKPRIAMKDDVISPYEYGFYLVNVGKLPAVNVKIWYKISEKRSNSEALDSLVPEIVNESITIYPNSEFFLRPSTPMMLKSLLSGVEKDIPDKAEIVFYISYETEATDKELFQKMKFIFCPEIDSAWHYSAENFDYLFEQERKRRSKAEIDDAISFWGKAGIPKLVLQEYSKEMLSTLSNK